MFGITDNTPLFILVYASINSTKFQASGAGIVSAPRFMSQVGDSARRSACFCNYSTGGVSIGLLVVAAVI
jgi:hypothetical protein